MLRRFLTMQDGNIAILFAVLFATLTAAAALAVDVGSLYLEKRRVQSAVDLAAIYAAQDPEHAYERARTAILDAGFIPNNIVIERLQDKDYPYRLNAAQGKYVADPQLTPAERFTTVAGQANAVRVRYEMPGRLYFAASWSPIPTISAEATAATQASVTFSIGSRLASLNEGIANALLNQLLGSSISLKAVDYNGLVGAQINLFAFLDALAQHLNITAGTYDDILIASADHGQIARAIADTLTGSQRVAALLIANSIGNNGRVPLSSLFNAGSLGRLSLGTGRTIKASLSALDLLSASAALGTGRKQVELKIAPTIPGLVELKAEVSIGEPPQHQSWLAIGGAGASISTAQIRIRIFAKLLGTGALLNAGVNLPLYVELAQSTARVQSVSCPDRTAQIEVIPGLARIAIGEVSDSAFKNFGVTPQIGSSKIVDVALLQVLGKSLVQVSEPRPVTLFFTSDDAENGRVKTANTRTIFGSLANTLLTNLSLDVRVLGLGLGLSRLGIANLVKSIIQPATPTLDMVILIALETLGIRVGEADIRVYDINCTTPALVG